MFYQEHPPAHFHAEYGEYEALLDINSLKIIEGNLPKRARLLVLEWALEHRSELEQNWENARNKIKIDKIKPLK
jgi:hypothetical protein